MKPTLNDSLPAQAQRVAVMPPMADEAAQRTMKTAPGSLAPATFACVDGCGRASAGEDL